MEIIVSKIAKEENFFSKNLKIILETSKFPNKKQMNEALGIFKTNSRIVKNSRNFHLKPNMRFWWIWSRRFVTYNLEGSRWVSWVCLSWCIWKSEWRSPWVWGLWSLLLIMTPFQFRRDDHTLCHIPKRPLCEHSRSQRWLQAVPGY